MAPVRASDPIRFGSSRLTNMVQEHEVLHLLVVSAVFTACLVYRVGCGVDGQQGGGEGLTWVAADKHGIRLFL